MLRGAEVKVPPEAGLPVGPPARRRRRLGRPAPVELGAVAGASRRPPGRHRPPAGPRGGIPGGRRLWRRRGPPAARAPGRLDLPIRGQGRADQAMSAETEVTRGGVPESAGGGSSPHPPQAVVSARAHDAHQGVQGAGRRDRHAHHLRGDPRPGHGAGGGDHAPGAHDLPPDPRQEAGAGADPQGRPGDGGRRAAPHAGCPRRSRGPLPERRDAGAGGVLLQDPPEPVEPGVPGPGSHARNRRDPLRRR